MLAILEPIWNGKPETAKRVRQRVEMVFDYAIASSWRVDNPAVAVSKVLPQWRGKKGHHPAMAYGKLPAFLQALRASTVDPVARLGLDEHPVEVTHTMIVQVHFRDEGNEYPRDSHETVHLTSASMTVEHADGSTETPGIRRDHGGRHQRQCHLHPFCGAPAAWPVYARAFGRGPGGKQEN